MILRQTHGFATEVDAMKTLAATLSLLFVSLSLPLATGCGDDKDTAGDDDGVTTSPLVEIISPADGTTITEGDTIQLEADIYDQDSGNPLTASDGPVGKRSPPASADSMFCNEPATLNSPMGTITER